jgi:hypothetical protein
MHWAALFLKKKGTKQGEKMNVVQRVETINKITIALAIILIIWLAIGWTKGRATNVLIERQGYNWYKVEHYCIIKGITAEKFLASDEAQKEYKVLTNTR